MQDADLGENVQDHAEEAEAQLPRDYRFQNDDAHLQPSRWWFASSAIPLIAGTLGPVASAFSICALARPWRQYLEPGEDITTATFVTDPRWLISINAVQLAVAVVSNAFLLLNMTRRVRFIIAQPITIAGWYISAILLVALTATAAGPLMEGLPEPPEKYKLSQAFWYGIWAAILYFAMAGLMTVTFWGAWTSHYRHDFILTATQRTLMLQTIMFLMYLLLGALVFSHVEGWNYLDAVYWADVTLFTVGFGDYAPLSTLGRALVVPYALVGIVSLGLVIASIRSMILERGEKRVSARIEERARRRAVRNLTKRGDDAILNPVTEQPHEPDCSQLNLCRSDTPSNEFERRRAEFELMRKIQESAAQRRRWFALATSTSTWLVLWLVGATIFQAAERPYQHWSYFDSFFFCFTALTTIGYGDFTPVSNAGKSFFVFWSLLALPTMTVLISNAGDTVIKFIREATLELGSITILPGDEDFMGNQKHVVSRLTLGRLFPDFYVFPKPLGPSGFPARSGHAGSEIDEPDGQNQSQSDADERGRGNFLDVAERAQAGNGRAARPGSSSSSTFTARVRRSLSSLRDPLEELPTGTDLHFLLISEVQAVSQHLRESTPRRYSFEEWAWYLKLIGEDERDPSNHRKPRQKPPNGSRAADHDELDSQPARGSAQIRDEDGRELEWSWVGMRSPLMGSKEESEWILDCLTHRLRESLSAERRRQLKKKPRTEDRLARAFGVAKGSSNMERALHEKMEHR